MAYFMIFFYGGVAMAERSTQRPFEDSSRKRVSYLASRSYLVEAALDREWEMKYCIGNEFQRRQVGKQSQGSQDAADDEEKTKSIGLEKIESGARKRVRQ
jgi:hypothetical protein